MRPEELRERQAKAAATEEALAEIVEREFAVIGKRLRKVDGAGKVSGSTVYTDDLVLPGMLHAKILRSPHAHARIVSVDTAAAEALSHIRQKLCCLP
jgi:xanthine dehydrogenase molybdopterin-binding subunit B